MKLSALAARDDAATKRIVAATEALVAHFGLDEAVLANVRTQRGTPPVRAMMQREAVAELLDAMVEKVTDEPESGEGEPETKSTRRKRAAK